MVRRRLDLPANFHEPRFATLRPGHWLPVFTGTGLLLAVLSVFMWGNLALGVLFVVIAALPVVLVVYIYRRIQLYRYGPDRPSDPGDEEPLDPLTGGPD